MTKSNINVKTAITELHTAFDLLNNDLFGNKLPLPAILIQHQGNRKNILGWCTTRQIWNVEGESRKYEINITAEFLNRDIYSIISTLLHEMVHLNNILLNVKDTSRGNSYHNENFKIAAEKVGLNVAFSKSIGWSITSLKEEMKAVVDSYKLNQYAFSLNRDFEESKKGKGKKGNSIKYQCPSCKCSVRATKTVNVMCGDCDSPMLAIE